MNSQEVLIYISYVNQSINNIVQKIEDMSDQGLNYQDVNILDETLKRQLQARFDLQHRIYQTYYKQQEEKRKQL